MQIYAASCLYPVAASPIEGGAIAVADGLIVDIGPLADLRARHAAQLHEFPGCVIMPGLVNAHTHLELTHFPSWKLRKGIDYAPRTYVDWVIQVIKIRRSLSREELELSVREGIRISLESGTTAVGEILTDLNLLPLYQASPLTGRLFFEAIGHDPTLCADLLATLDKSLASFDAGRLRQGLSPHSSHTLSPQFMRDITSLALRHDVPSVIHLAESREEAAFLHDSSGKIAELLYPLAGWETFIPHPLRTTPTAYLDSFGVLTPAMTAVHCVHVTPADVELLRQRGVNVVLCPRSNDRLDVGKAPAALLKKKGIPLALGTDSLASNDSLSLWDEMRFLRREFPGLFSPAEILAMTTICAAQALHMADRLGSLEKGKQADFLVVQLEHSAAPDELPEALIEASRVVDIFCEGRRYGR